MFLGLDPASELFGATCGDGAEPPIAQAWKFPQVKGDYGLLLSTLYGYLDVTFRRWPTIRAVGYESPILKTKGRGNRYADKLSTLRLLYPLGPFVEWYCRDIAHVPCHEVTNGEAKKEITGDSYAQKEDIAKIAEHCGVLLPIVGRTDASDSWAVWKFLLRHYDPEISAKWDRKIYGARPGALF